MDKLHYEEMVDNLNVLIKDEVLEGKRIYLFGHCNATEELVDCLIEKKYMPAAILDNNPAKHGKKYNGVVIISPEKILEEDPESCFVCIAARAYAAMSDQLKRIGYKGSVRKLVDYNSYAEYSLSEDTLARMKQRVERGQIHLKRLDDTYPGYLKILCPFSALGDIYLMMSYLPYYRNIRGILNCVVGVIGNACADVVRLFGDVPVEVFLQKDMDETIQAALYMRDKLTFIPHQDRPYVVNLHRALYIKKIPLEQIYCCGVFGLSKGTKPIMPTGFCDYPELERIPRGNAVILSPYAKSVTALPANIWKQIIRYYRDRGYQCFTNISGDETPLEGTEGICPSIPEIRSVVEHAGTFIGIRSGLCDILRTARAKKIALYPDYNYCDTNWKAIDLYQIEGWENIVVEEMLPKDGEMFRLSTLPKDGEKLRLSTLPKTWVFDLDGTLVKHNGYKIDGVDTILPGALEYLQKIPFEDKIIIFTSRTEEYKQMTLDFLSENGIRYDEILFNMPMGERIVVNDRKPSGLNTAVAINIDRNQFLLPEVIREK